jgi:hypothetical protein
LVYRPPAVLGATLYPPIIVERDLHWTPKPAGEVIPDLR